MSKKDKIFHLFLVAISLVSVFGSVIYRFYCLNWAGVILTLLLSATGGLFFYRLIGMDTGRSIYPDGCRDRYDTKSEKGMDTGRNSSRAATPGWYKKMSWSLPYFFFFLFSFFFLSSARTDSALTSPWQAVSPVFFAVYLLATAALILAIKKNALPTILTSLHYFLSFSALWAVFKYGYGYDPFIHQASLELIDKQGYIQPKQFLYLGQYSLEIVAHKLFFLPIDWLDKLLLPVLTALTLPKAIKYFLSLKLPIANYQLPILILLILPFSIFSITVPQNLAYLFLLLSLFAGLSRKDGWNTALAALLALASFCCHPLAGIPALAWAFLLTANRILKEKVKVVALSLGLLGTAAALPLALYVSQMGKTGGAEAPLPANASNLLWGFARQENIILNFIHFFSYYQNIWLTAIFATALIFSFLKRKELGELTLAAGMSLSLLTAFFATKLFVSFGSLISYERGDYLIRILTESFLFIMPAIALLAASLLGAIERQNRFSKTVMISFLALAVVASLYCSYPRKDNYFNSRSFSVSAADFNAVKAVEQDAGGKPYVVLANQQVSVAALKTFGFNRYFQNYQEIRNWQDINVYFYPIPTGGPLYRTYLDMVYKKADRETARKASQLTGAKTVYFILNEYWWAFDKIKEEAKISAEDVLTISNGDIVIFKYSFN